MATERQLSRLTDALADSLGDVLPPEPTFDSRERMLLLAILYDAINGADRGYAEERAWFSDFSEPDRFASWAFVAGELGLAMRPITRRLKQRWRLRDGGVCLSTPRLARTSRVKRRCA